MANELVLHPESHSIALDGETYSMTEVPKAGMSLVAEAKTKVLGDLSLDKVLANLDLSADLIYLAYTGTKAATGTKDVGPLTASIFNRHTELAEVCAECVRTMETLRDVSRDIAETLAEAFDKLVNEGNEEWAIDILSDCADKAKTMAVKCDTLAKRFEKLRDDTKTDCAKAENLVGVAAEKLRTLQELRTEMTAQLKEQEALQADLKNSIEKLNKAVAEAKENEKVESDRQFTLGIVSSVFGAIGAGLGAGVGMASGGMGRRDAALAPKPPENQPVVVPQDIVENKAKKKEEETKKSEEVDEAKKEVERLEDVVMEKEGELNKAKVTNDQAQVAKAEEEKKTAVKDMETAKGNLIKAERALEAAGAALKEASGTIDKMVAQANEKRKELRSERLGLLDKLDKVEEQNRTALGSVAKLTSQLGANATQSGVEQSTQAALEMTVWALHNIYVALENARFFWDGMERYCLELASPEIKKKLEREIKFQKDPEKRKKYYADDPFMPQAIYYLVRWAALGEVCDDYVKAAQVTQTKISRDIGKSPTVAESIDQLETLKAQLVAKLGDANLTSQAKSREIKEATRAVATETDKALEVVADKK